MRAPSYYGITSGGARIGEGTYGFVVESASSSKNRYATKISKKDGISIDFLVETSTLVKLNHPNIVHVKDVVKLGDLADALDTEASYGLVFELASSNMLVYLDRKKLTKKAKKQLMYDLLCGLSYLHSLEIIHRDLKPHNILMFGDKPEIADLGSAKNYACHPRGDWTDEVSTLWYRAPELFVGDVEQLPKAMSFLDASKASYDKEIDIWSMGVILYQIMTGKAIYRGGSNQDQILGYGKVLREPIKTLDGFSTFDKAFQKILLSMLDFNLSTRATITDILKNSYWNNVRDPSREYGPLGCDLAIEMQSRYIDTPWTKMAPPILPKQVYIVLEWLLEVARMFRLKRRTFCLTSKLLCESLLQLDILALGDLQKLGCVCMDVASKMSEYNSPGVDDYEYISNNSFDKDEFQDMEELVLKALRFDTNTATAMDYSEKRTEVKDLWADFVLMAAFPSFSGALLKLHAPASVAKAADELLSSDSLSSESKKVVESVLETFGDEEKAVSLKKALTKWRVDHERVVAAIKKALG